MNSIIIDREILMSEDFTGDFAKKLCAYLNLKIDEELAKGDETDFDLIDEYAGAINYIRENGAADIIPLISDREFLKKLGLAGRPKAVRIAAAAAAVALIIGTGSVIARQGTPSEIARDVAKYFRELFNVTEHEPVTEQVPETATVKAAESTTQQVIIKSIELKFGDNFRREYFVGESFDKTGLEVNAITGDGLFKTDDYKIEFDSPFAEKAGEQTVTVTACGFSESFKVRILNNEKTPILNSIYATFPEGFDFTYKGEPETVLGEMRVFAVYSTGEKQELEKDEYTVSITETGLLFKKRADVKVEYKGCSCEFMLQEVLK